MRLIKVMPQGFECNSYILTADGKTAVVIDCSEGAYEACASNGLTPAAVLLTHGHFDHVGGCGAFYKAGIPVYCGEHEKNFIFSPANRGIFGGVHIPEFEIYKTLADGEIISLAGIELRVMHTPGHTAGSVCYIAGNCLFSGDTLFRLGIGRADLPTGDSALLAKSVKKLFALGSFRVYCGHGEATSLTFEKENNPYA